MACAALPVLPFSLHRERSSAASPHPITTSPHVSPAVEWMDSGQYYSSGVDSGHAGWAASIFIL